MRIPGRAFDRHDFAHQSLALFRRDQERLRGSGDFIVGVDGRESGLGGNRARQQLALLLDELSRAAKNAVALGWIEFVLGKRSVGCADRRIHLFARGAIGYANLSRPRICRRRGRY